MREEKRAGCAGGHARKWYAVQVETGREDAACGLIARTAKALDLDFAIDELFSPKRRTWEKAGEEFVSGEVPLLPGYVIVVARPRALADVAEVLLRLPRFARLVSSGGHFVPLHDSEVSWICAFTQRGRRVVEMSRGFVEGGRVVVTAGPLVGKEAMIVRVNRRKRIAEVELTICGRRVTAKVGLSLMKEEKLRRGAPAKDALK